MSQVPQCSADLGLESALNLTYEDGRFTAANATRVGENTFRFSAGGDTYQLELVGVERNDADELVSLAFRSTLRVDAAVVRSAQGASVYAFPEAVTERSGLRARPDPQTGQPVPIEGVTFCFDPETPNRGDASGGTFDALADGLAPVAGEGTTAGASLLVAGLLLARRRD